MKKIQNKNKIDNLITLKHFVYILTKKLKLKYSKK